MPSRFVLKEKEFGVTQPECAVLATCTASGIPHSRVVAIREIKTIAFYFLHKKERAKLASCLLILRQR